MDDYEKRTSLINGLAAGFFEAHGAGLVNVTWWVRSERFNVMREIGAGPRPRETLAGELMWTRRALEEYFRGR